MKPRERDIEKCEELPGDAPEPSEGDGAEGPEREEFGELIKFTLSGFVAGILAGTLLDHLGFQASALGQWLVRTLSGEGESIFEGAFALRRRLTHAAGSMAEAYGWGKLMGMAAPWIIDAASRLAGVHVNSVQGFYIPYFYALSDQMGANVSGLIYLKKQERSWTKALARYFRHPVMLTSLLVLLLAPVGLLLARLAGFSPTTQTRAALETIAANLCWLPPLVGWARERFS